MIQWAPETPESRTLLIIQGAYRTFDHAVDSVMDNLIKTNAPCDVVLSMDRESPATQGP